VGRDKIEKPGTMTKRRRRRKWKESAPKQVSKEEIKEKSIKKKKNF